MIKVKIDNGSEILEVPYKDGIPISEVYNEQLDSGTIIIPNVDELKIKRLDKVLFEENGNVIKRFLVGTYIKTRVTPTTWDYTINLISPTILMQIPLPNISITQRIPNLSIYDEIVRLVSTFTTFDISDKLKTVTENVDCPEMQWNKRNLWEIINDLLITIGYVVTMKDFATIDCISLHNEGTPIDETKITNLQEQFKLDEYCNEIEVNAENVVGGKWDTFTLKNITPRSSDYVMTTKNCQLILDKPIYFIDKVIAKVIINSGLINYVTDDNPQTKTYHFGGYKELDITKFVVENSVYILKEPSNNEMVYTIKKDGYYIANPDIYKYKRMFLNYSEGSEVIDNLTYNEKNIIGMSFSEYSLINIILYSVIEDFFKNRPNVIFFEMEAYTFDTVINDPREVMFDVKYTSQNNVRYRVKKKDAINQKVLVDNQSNSYVDIDALVRTEKENISRIGNPEMIIDMKLDSLSEIPTLSATYGDYVLSQSEYTIYSNCIFFRGVFTKDFVRKSLYTGLKSKARWTSIAKSSEALERQDLIKNEIKIGVVNGNPVNRALISNMISNIGKVKNNYLFAIKTEFEDKNESSYILTNMTRYNLGDKILLNYKLKDNYNANMKIVESSTDAYTSKQVPYVDDNGEFKYINIYVCEDDLTIDSNNYDAWLEKSKNYPEIEILPTILFEEKHLVNKDNREIYGNNMQIEFTSNKDFIIVKDYFIELNPLVCQSDKIIKTFYSTKTYTINDEYIGNEGTMKDFEYENNSISITTTNNYSSWGLCDENGKILLVCNSADYTKIYLNGGNSKLC